MNEAEMLIEDYPWLEEVYRDVAQNLNKPEEVLGMFSEALKIMDRNTALYMIEQQQEEFKAKLEETNRVHAEEMAKNNELHAMEMAEMNNAITEKDNAIAEKTAELAKQIAQAKHYKELLKQAGISVD